jgi:phage terminase small subunit
VEVKLKPKQALFAKEYLKDFNATQAAVRAGYSIKTAHVIGTENLKKPVIEKAIEKEMVQRTKNVEISVEWILQGVKGIADNLEETTKDRLKAYELLGKYWRMFTDKHEVNASGNSSIKFMFVEPENE